MKTIKAKLIAYMLVFVTGSLLAGWAAIYRYVGAVILEETLQNHVQIVDAHVNKLEGVLRANENYATTIGYTPEVQRSILECYSAADSYARLVSNRELEYRMTNYVILRPEYIASIYMADREMEGVLAHRDIYTFDMRNSWLPGMGEIRDKPYYSGVRSMTGSAATTQQLRVISYMLPVRNIQRENDILGHLVINLDMERLFDDAYREYEDIEGYYLVDAAGGVVYAAHYPGGEYARGIDPGAEGIVREQGRYYITQQIPALRMGMVVVVRESGITSIVAGVLRILLLIMGLCLVMAIVTSLGFVRSITRPIQELTASMMQVAKGDFDVVIPVRSKDEIGKMSQIFNYMSREIKKLMDRNNEMNEQQKAVTMKLFLSKINPHFIYNTLNCIIYLARKGDTGDIEELTRSFIQILRKNIAFDSGEVTIGEEVEYLGNYMDILKYRYNDMLEIRFDIPEQVLPLHIQPMILYPIVENSVFHGISAKQAKGTVTVEARVEEGRLLFRIADDGVGIPPGKLAYIRDYLGREDIRETSGNIGLRNTNDRLVLCYGEESRLHIESEPGVGTAVTFFIPK